MLLLSACLPPPKGGTPTAARYGRLPRPLDDEGRRRLHDAILLFEEVLRIKPDNSSAMWLLGKIYQRLEDHERGLEWFARAHEIKPDQPDVASCLSRDADRERLERSRSG